MNFTKNQIEVYKDSILKLQAEREKDSVITVEVIKYVQVKEVDFKKKCFRFRHRTTKKRYFNNDF